VRWTLDGEEFVPTWTEKSLGDQGIGHKSLLRFWTPGLDRRRRVRRLNRI
jgi:phenol hydroxylase P4 protein